MTEGKADHSFHSAVVVAGIGFFTDSYDIFAVSLLTTMLGIVYYPSAGALPTTSDSAIKLSTSAGTVIGQLLFGWLADNLGRKKMYGIELIIIIFATFGQALSSDSPSINIVGIIIFWRVLMGVGIGGDYPLSSIITSEFATTKWRGAMMAAVFAMQGIGQLVCALVMLFITLGFKEALLQSTSVTTCDAWCAVAVDKMWRTLIGFGAVPACIALYYRLTIPETPVCQMTVLVASFTMLTLIPALHLRCWPRCREGFRRCQGLHVWQGRGSPR